VGLANGLHISSSGSYSMTEDEAVGPMMCRIERDSCAYGLLVANRDSNIGFSTHKPAPLTDEDRQMHPALVMPLARLSQMVLQEWKGAENLYVTASYDSTGEHDPNQPDPKRKYSLHYEGRALDLILSPWDPAKLDRLCALSYCAGFNWVHNEGDHCHVSINAQSLCSFCSGSVPTPIPSDTPTRQ
jgi:hedgehog protein